MSLDKLSVLVGERDKELTCSRSLFAIVFVLTYLSCTSNLLGRSESAAAAATDQTLTYIRLCHSTD